MSHPVADVHRITSPAPPTAYIASPRASIAPVFASAAIVVQVVPSKRMPARARNQVAPASGVAAATPTTMFPSPRSSGNGGPASQLAPSKWAMNASDDVAAPDGTLSPTAQTSVAELPDRPKNDAYPRCLNDASTVQSPAAAPGCRRT